MLERLINILAPDYCCNCSKIGAILCESCINDIENEAFSRCVVCLTPSTRSNLCRACTSCFDDAWVVGERTGALEKLVDASKFESNRRACLMQARLLDSRLPKLHVVIVPIPTITPHIRRRGYGHMEIVARELGQHRGWPVKKYLQRRTNHIQHGADKKTRQQQAAEAFELASQIDDHPLLLLDDVYTTGATLREAAMLLRTKTMQPIYVAVSTRQMLDEKR